MLLFRFFDKPTITFVINSPTFLNSFNPNPLVVAAGVPSLIPDVIVGFSVSKGIPFLLLILFLMIRPGGILRAKGAD